MKIKLTQEAKSLIQKMHPEIKKGLRSSLESLSKNKHFGKALHDELEGFYSLRYKNYRLIYSIENNLIIIQYVGHRAQVYEDFALLLQ